MTERLSDKNPCNDCKLYSPCTGPCGKWHEWNRNVLQKLAEYETAEEEGRLVVLPCKVGDTVYEICSRFTRCTSHGNRFNDYCCKGCKEECDSKKEYFMRYVKNTRAFSRERFKDKYSFGYGHWEKYEYILANSTEIELIGLCTDICVISNALILKAFFPDVKITVDASCCAGTTQEFHEAAVKIMKSCQINVIGDE